MAKKNTEPIAIGDHLQTFTNDEHLKQETSNSKGVIAICDNLPQNAVETRIITIRGAQVMLDRDLAELYGVPTYRLNEQVKRNIKRFPERFRFQLTSEEIKGLIANNDRLSSLQYNPSKPYAYSEQGVAMLSSVLHSDDAIEISIRMLWTSTTRKPGPMNSRVTSFSPAWERPSRRQAVRRHSGRWTIPISTRLPRPPEQTASRRMSLYLPLVRMSSPSFFTAE